MGLAEYAQAMKADVLVAYKLIGYFDESEEDKTFCMAGVIASARHWAAFEDPWSALVAEYDGMSEFHMQECENRLGFWKDWDDPADRRAVQQRFLNLIVGHPLPFPMGLVVGIDVPAYEARIRELTGTEAPSHGRKALGICVPPPSAANG